ncbi:MAG: hypothetical protein AB7O26_16655, partial [Planctomycetaceae bacterium]
MSQRLRVHELPLLTAGLPQMAESWLRLAGVPLVPLNSTTIHARPADASAQLLLFDSRNAEACSDARHASDSGVRTLDTAPIWGSAAISPVASRAQRQVRARILERLKREIERSGGTWIRVADYPSPYQCAACFGTRHASSLVSQFAGAFELLPARFAESVPIACRRISDSTFVVDRAAEEMCIPGDAAASEDVDDWIRRRYSQGQPFAVADAFDCSTGACEDIPFNPERFPLLWRTTFAEFSMWWKLRASIVIRAHCRGSIVQVDCENEFEMYRPMLELWRG